MAWFFPFPLTLYLDDPEPGFTCRFFHSQLSFRAWLIKFYFGVQLGHRSQIFNYYNTDRAYWEPRSSTNIFILTKNDCTNVRLQYVQENINSSISSIRPLLVLLEYRKFDIKICLRCWWPMLETVYLTKIMLVTTLGCRWLILHIVKVINIMILPPKSLNFYHHKVTNMLQHHCCQKILLIKQAKRPFFIFLIWEFTVTYLYSYR